ncbi:MAG: multimeric flavodoxin WrbA [Saprospiraceae bacterium]|jgi:multimeric flavodoxin WrbA
MNKGVIILGSSASKGETYQMATFLSTQTGFPIIDLTTKNIGEFDYEFKNADDDFIPLIKEIAEKYDTLVFATPVYWYAMSGIMKTFFDRISDCLKTEKETGRKLRGKSIAVLSSASEDELKDGFLMPFIESANYLGMNYLGNVHGWQEDGEMPKIVRERLIEFAKNYA